MLHQLSFRMPRMTIVVLGVLVALNGTTRGQQPTETSKPTPNQAEEAMQAAKWLQGAFKGKPTPEAAQMLIAIAKGTWMNPGEGWFRPAQSRFDWAWLADKHGVKPGGSVPRVKFLGTEAHFARLDRNKDGVLRADDFDWSDRTVYAQQGMMINFWFGRVNRAGDGKLTREEWLKFFEEASRGKDHLTTDNLREALFGGSLPDKTKQSDLPTQEMLVRSLFSGELGSMNEGPKLNEPAPDFTLRTRDGKETIRLSDQFGKKPIVLMFGNFTCTPFRRTYPRVDELALRYKNDALFLGVYVREAHPTDGWRMEVNEQAGVSFAQPRDFTERTAMANRCAAKLSISFPMLVDEMDDRVGNAYSGMPARLYVFDHAGKVAYKSGRGPFGFKPDEMEQSLVMLLMDQQKRPASRAKTDGDIRK